MSDPTPSNSDIAAANPIQPTASTVPDNQIEPNTAPAVSAGNIPNPIPANSPASLGVTPSPVKNQPQTPTAPVQTSLAPKPTPQQQAKNLHTSIFSTVLSTLAGGSQRPVIGPNGQPQTDANGNVVMGPAPRKALGASIVAGALSAMIAGMATPTHYQELPGGRVVADNSAAFGAGAQAGQQFTQAGAKAKAQDQADEN